MASTLDYGSVNALVRTANAVECNWRWNRVVAGLTLAALGDDGRYHLIRDRELLCMGLGYVDSDCDRKVIPGAIFPHRRCFEWWTDGTHYRLRIPASASSGAALFDEVVRWPVQLANDTTDPTTVPPSQRCTYVGSRSDWPPFCASFDPLSTVRRRLVEVAGDRCHACGLRTGSVVDHDHFTGLVRGLLCTHCNAWIDTCPHLTGCPWAHYLNAPPAQELSLRHPHAGSDRSRARARIDSAGVDPYPS
ncbi:endonuclease domain-containing protein [Crossiella sp. CA198]|uniref:endonuclease domain-containing protein n=1 Tax=Crossiella sp. CA198 TaxID=3455607 RepID=UPI003F8D140D